MATDPVERDVWFPVFETALALHEQFPPDGNWYFTRFPINGSPHDVLHALRASPLASVMLDDGALMNDPDGPSYEPIQPVHASPNLLQSAWLLVHVWPRSSEWRGDAAEIVAQLVYKGAATVNQCVGVSASAKRVRLVRYTYDAQRVATGYEGENRAGIEPGKMDVRIVTSLLARLASI